MFCAERFAGREALLESSESPADTGKLLNDKIRTCTYNKDKNVRKTRKECDSFLLFLSKSGEMTEKLLKKYYGSGITY